MRVVISALLAAVVLAGCAESQFGGSIFYLKPYNIENLTCAELKTRIDGAEGTIKVKSDLREKAATDSIGSAIGATVYGPDQNAARWAQRQYQAEAARKNCDTTPPPGAVTPAGAATASAGAPAPSGAVTPAPPGMMPAPPPK